MHMYACMLHTHNCMDNLSNPTYIKTVLCFHGFVEPIDGEAAPLRSRTPGLALSRKAPSCALLERSSTPWQHLCGLHRAYPVVDHVRDGLFSLQSVHELPSILKHSRGKLRMDM